MKLGIPISSNDDSSLRKSIAMNLMKRWEDACSRLTAGVDIVPNYQGPVYQDKMLQDWAKQREIRERNLSRMDEIMGAGQDIYGPDFLVDEFCINYRDQYVKQRRTAQNS